MVYRPVQRSHFLDLAHKIDVAPFNFKQSLTTLKSVVLDLLHLVGAVTAVPLNTTVHQRRVAHEVRIVNLEVYSILMPFAYDPIYAVKVTMPCSFLKWGVPFGVEGKQDTLDFVPRFRSYKEIV